MRSGTSKSRDSLRISHCQEKGTMCVVCIYMYIYITIISAISISINHVYIWCLLITHFYAHTMSVLHNVNMHYMYVNITYCIYLYKHIYLYMHLYRWTGYIKEYDGGTLMECYVHPNVNYLCIPKVFIYNTIYIFVINIHVFL